MDERFYISKISGEIATFDAGEANHISKVRRKSVGDEIKGFNGDGYDYTLKIEAISKSGITAKIQSKQKNQAMYEPNITVYLAMLKNDALTTAIDYLAELNVRNVKLFKADFSIANVDEKKLEKLNAISIQASKQCERADIMKVGIINKADIKKDCAKITTFFAYENASEPPTSFSGDFAIIIGAEGGFSPDEVQYFSGFAKQVSLGKTIMRAPVACVSAVSSLKILNQ